MSGISLYAVKSRLNILLVKFINLAILSNCGKVHNDLLIPNGNKAINWTNSQPNPLMDAVQRLNVNRLVKSLRYSLVYMRNHAVDRWVVNIGHKNMLICI